MENIVVQVILTIGGVVGGGYALIKHLMSQTSASQKIFLEHLEKKNGHTERMAKEFSETVRGFQGSMNENSVQLARMNENYRNIVGVLSDSARALQDHHKHS